MKWSDWKELRTVLPYLRRYKKVAATAMVFMVLAALVPLLGPLPIAFLIDVVFGNHPAPGSVAAMVGTGKYALLLFGVAFGVVVTVLPHAVNGIYDYVNTKLDEGISLDFRTDIYEHCQGLSQAYYDDKSTGDFIYRITTEANAAGALAVGVPSILKNVLTVVVMFVIAFQLDPMLVLLSVTVIPGLQYAIRFYGSRIEPHLVHVRNLEGLGVKMVSEAMRMLTVIVSFNRQAHEHRRFREQGEAARDARLRVTARQTFFAFAVGIVSALGMALALGVGGSHVLQGSITVGELIIVVSYIQRMYEPLTGLAPALAELQKNFISLRFAKGLLDTEPDVKESPHARPIAHAQGQVEYDGVHFAYPGRNETLKDISFTAEAGETVAIVGPTGAGKSTLMNLLPRFRDPQRGRILVDGTDIQELTLESWRGQISIVHQETLLFSATIAENIRYGRLTADDEEVVEAAKRANVHDFITSLPDGYDTWLGERGVKVSGGERQRLSLARAFLKDAPLLILDEPTSSIDSETEAGILAVLERLMAGRTTFTIAHRLSTLRHADRILVLKEGELIEEGTHDQLVAYGGFYHYLFTLQQEGLAAVGAAADEPGAEAESPNGGARLLPSGNDYADAPASSQSGAPTDPKAQARTAWRRG